MHHIRGCMGGPTDVFIKAVNEAKVPNAARALIAEQHLRAKWLTDEREGSLSDFEKDLTGLVSTFKLDIKLFKNLVASFVKRLAETTGISTKDVQDLYAKDLLECHTAQNIIDNLPLYDLKRTWLNTEVLHQPIADLLKALDELTLTPVVYRKGAVTAIIEKRIEAGVYQNMEALAADLKLVRDMTWKLGNRERGGFAISLQRKLTGEATDAAAK